MNSATGPYGRIHPPASKKPGKRTLVCGRHHTIVHQRGWTATVTAAGVTWHT